MRVHVLPANISIRIMTLTYNEPRPLDASNLEDTCLGHLRSLAPPFQVSYQNHLIVSQLDYLTPENIIEILQDIHLK